MCGAAEHFPPIGGLAGHAADDDHPGVHPDAHTKADEAAIRQQKLMFLDRRGDRERSAHRAFGIIFMGLWHAKICQQSVPNQSGDVTAVAANLLVADIAVGSDNREEFFGIMRSLRGVEPMMSTNATVSWRRSAGRASLPTFGGACVN